MGDGSALWQLPYLFLEPSRFRRAKDPVKTAQSKKG